MNRLIKGKKTCNKNCLCKQKSRTGQLHWGSLPYKEALKSMLLKLVPKLKRTEYYQIHSMTPLSPWYQSQTKTLQKQKIQTNIFDEYRYKNTQNISKLNPIYIKRTEHHDQVGFIPRMQRYFNIQKSLNVSKLKNKNYTITSINTENEFKQNATSFHNKNYKTRYRGNISTQ